ncbi:hypothetical protein B9Z55_022897 [Caenorhabditis nigoni]|uniref:Uncharacterized protein n=1 Tax=Caenorhabditis nigoni TaxID=1611254 RepID=A0A2G5SMW6_9PELO|nr:hypothetical protein B9Z55_022897 [Caenorhabditis nigoni]
MTTTPSPSAAPSQPMASMGTPDAPSTFSALPGYGNQLRKMQVSREVPENQPIQFVVYKCVKNSEVLLLGVHRKQDRYLKFEYNRNQFKEHNCICQTPTMESDLIPLYAEKCEDLKAFVIHCENSLNGKKEQYIVNTETENLVQVFRPELQFQEERKTADRHAVAYCNATNGLILIKRSEDGLKKERFEKTGGTVYLPDSPVRKLDLTEDDNDDKTIEIDVELSGHFKDYLNSLPVYKSWYCKSSSLMNVRVKIPNTTTYLDYYFENGSMLRSPECQECSKEVTLQSLIPKYSVKLNGFKTVLFCRNVILETIEQYVLDSQKIVLKQVFLPELLYDATLVNHEDIDVFFIENGILVSKKGIILIVKKLNRDTKHYEEIPNVPVKIMDQESEASDAREEESEVADLRAKRRQKLMDLSFEELKSIYEEKNEERIAMKKRRFDQGKKDNKKDEDQEAVTDQESEFYLLGNTFFNTFE